MAFELFKIRIDNRRVRDHNPEADSLSLQSIQVGGSAGTTITNSNVVTTSNSVALTGKTFNAPDNTLTNIADVNVSGSAAIAESKLALSYSTSGLHGAIVAEASSRGAQDIVLQGNIDAEASARGAQDIVLQGNIDAEASARGAAILGEASARGAQDIVLQGNIDAEASARGAAILGEASARGAQDIVLQGNIDAEASARGAADSDLQGDLEALDGAGLVWAGAAGESALNVNMDNATLEVYSDALRVKASGLSNIHISAGAAIDELKVSGLVNDLAAKLPIAGGTMNGNIQMQANKIMSSYVALDGVDLVNKTYIDNVLTGITWKNTVDAFNLLGNDTPSNLNGKSPVAGDQWVVTGSGSLTLGSLAVNAGDLVEFKDGAWILLDAGVGGFVDNDTRAVLGGAGGTIYAPYTNGVDNGKVVSFSGASNTGVNTGDAANKNSLLAQDDASVSVWDNSSYVFEGSVPTGKWIQFNGAGQIAAGVGLNKVGNTLSVLLGTGITELPTGEVGVDLAPISGLSFFGSGSSAQLQLDDSVAGTALSVINKVLNVVYDDVTIGVNASLGLYVRPLYDDSIAVGAGILESKLDLDYSTASLKADINALGDAAQATFTNGEAGSVVLGDVCYEGTDGKAYKAGSGVASIYKKKILVAMATITAGSPGKYLVRWNELVAAGSGLASGEEVYLSHTLGGITQNVALIPSSEEVVIVGYARSATSWEFAPRDIGPAL